jgi:hypothetical protein
MNIETTRRTFIKTSAALAVGTSVPAIAADGRSGLVDQIRGANLGEIRYIHIQCNRSDGPSLQAALALVEAVTGESDHGSATGCGDLETREHFLIHQPLSNGGMAVFTSAERPGSWGIVRGSDHAIELT